MEGHRSGCSSASCSSWAAFEENAREYDSSHGWPGSGWNPISPPAGRLCREDMAIYGEEPAMDSLSLVVCRCGRVVKSQALVKHEELYHSEMIKITPPMRTPTPVFTIGQSPAMNTGGKKATGSAEGEVKGFVATGLPISNTNSHSSGGKGAKGYDPDRHCGVWIEEEKRVCTRSITCKFHSLSLRRKVSGRSKPFNELLDIRKKRKNSKRGHKHTEPSLPPPAESPLQSPSLNQPTSLGTWSPTNFSSTLQDGWLYEPASAEGRQAEENSSSPHLPGASLFPHPLAACSFGSRSTRTVSSLVFGRRQDQLRSVFARLSGPDTDYTSPTLHRKHSYQSLLLDRPTPRRKYFAKIRKRPVGVSSSQGDSRRLPASLAMSHPHTPVYTPSLGHTLNSPLLAGGSGTVPPQSSEAQSIAPSQFYGTASHVHNSIGMSSDADSIVPSDSVSSSKSPATQESRKKSKRGRRPKRQRNKSKATNSVASKSHEQLLDTGQSLERALPLNSFGAPGSTDVSSQDRQHLLEQRTAASSEATRMSEMRVTIKQEPFSNHEDRMDTSERSEQWMGSPVGKAPQKPHSLAMNGMVPQATPTGALTPFNSRSLAAPQGTFVINPTNQQPHTRPPIMTSISPHLSGIVPLNHGGSLASPPTLSPNHHQHSASGGPAFTLSSSVQPGFVSEQLQRHMLQQQTALWAAVAVTSSNSLNSDMTVSTGRVPMDQQQQNRWQHFQYVQQQQQNLLTSQLASKGVSLGNVSSTPGTHVGAGLHTQPQVVPPSPLSGKYQISPAGSGNLASHRSLPAGKVRAPISQIPTGHPLQPSPATLSPDHYHHRTSNVINRSSLQNKQTLTQRSHLPSQQVT